MHNNNNIYPLWIDIRTACKMFCISKPTLLKIIHKGDVIAVKKLGKWLINTNSLNDYFMDEFKQLELLKKSVL